MPTRLANEESIVAPRSSARMASKACIFDITPLVLINTAGYQERSQVTLSRTPLKPQIMSGARQHRLGGGHVVARVIQPGLDRSCKHQHEGLREIDGGGTAYVDVRCNQHPALLARRDVLG